MKAIEVAIIGGGPAGSATALSLIKHAFADEKQSIQVTQVCGPNSLRDAIGETIPPAATVELRKLGVSDLLSSDHHLPCPGSHSVWGNEAPGFNDFFFTPIGKGYHLNRRVFNEQLRSAAQDQGVNLLIDAKLTGMSKNKEGYSLSIEQGAELCHRRADFIVDATGIQAKIARALGVARNQYDTVVSACHIFDLAEQPNQPAHTLVCAVDTGWWYGTQLPNRKVLISFCTDKETLKASQINTAEVWFEKLNQSGWFIENCVSQFGMTINCPDAIDSRVSPSAILSCVIGDHWLAVGDAASSYDSMTSAGITKALAQGVEAGAAIASWLIAGNKHQLASYQQNVFDAFNQYLKLHQELYGAEQRFSNEGFWRRRLFSIQ